MKKALLIMFSLCANVVLNAQVPTNGLAAYYPFNNNTLDYIGTRHGVSVGTAQYGTDRWGNSNACYDVIDHTNYINLPNDYWITGDYSISVWVNIKAVTQYPRAYDFGNGYLTNDAIGKLSNQSNSCPTMEYYSSSSTGTSFLTTTPLVVGTWYHIAYIQQGSTSTIYINNVSAGTYSNAAIPENIFRTKNKIGGSNAPLNDDTQAYFDDFRLYTRALTSQEVGQLYNETQITSVNEMTGNNKFEIYPNPNNEGLLHISSFSNETLSFKIFDALGNAVAEGTSLIPVSVSHLSAGTYNVVVEKDNIRTCKKLVIFK